MASKDIKRLVAQTKKLQEVSRVKRNLEETLKELTVCNNVSILSEKPAMFHKHILRASCKVVGAEIFSLESHQTLVITVQNVSEKLVFNSNCWQFCINLNGSTQSTWNLDNSLAPGQEQRFCCPLNNFFPAVKVCVSLKFLLQFDSKMHTRSFSIHEFLIDALYCLDPGAIISETSTQIYNLPEHNLADFYTNEESNISFPSITKFMLRLDDYLKRRLFSDILLKDSSHRGFSGCVEISDKSQISVYFEGNKIDVSIPSKSDFVSFKCENPMVLCAVKASVLRRLVSVEGITIDGLDNIYMEKVYSMKTKLAAFESDCNADTIDVSDLFAMYLELRDVSESIRFSVVESIN